MGNGNWDAMGMKSDWNSESNWSIAWGSCSIRQCITLESSDDHQQTDSSVSPVLLHPPSPDSPPCEIRITFSEKHELRQIYVRSSARVYEIYYDTNDYLSTVRCGPALGSPPSIQHPPDDDWVQDLYEATAEISDADPCISVTLRLLSLQNKGCVYVDEIYVFADPLHSPHSESPHHNPSATSLMAMFLPLMQFSKTSGLTDLRKENQHVPRDELEADSVIKAHPSLSHLKLKDAKTDCNPSADPSQGDSLGGKLDRALQHLVSRMDRIEQICLSFQDKMLIPICTLEARLQRLEQQLDTFTNILHTSSLVSPTISAPDTSFVQSDANSCHNSLHSVVTKETEPVHKHLYTQEPYVSPHVADSANSTQLLPSLVVTVPEFPDGEDEEGNASGQETHTSKDKGKLSIDDALSSALANFLSSMSLESPKYTKSLTVKAPEFSNEDDDDHASNSEMAKNDSFHLTDSEEISHIQILASSNTSLENSEKINPDANDKYPEKTAREAEEYGQLFSAEADQDNLLAEHNPKTGFIDNFEEDKNGKINGEKSDSLSSSISDISNELLDNQIPCGYSITEEGSSAGTDLTVSTEVTKKTSYKSIIENVLGLSLASSVVDFENPILDVKFIPQRSAVTHGFLEDLLVENQESNSSRDPYVKESSDDISIVKSNGDVSVEEESNLIPIEDGKLVNPASDIHFAVDKDLCEHWRR
ncbi:hypothetical protein VNO78_04972 [Psophocarpus tetragonolobus]|uniref:Uncharacterized protein n=1 Tax=Psophocarpus tetragonolobus TaxID=3891 RepID=A0AAN9SQL3_PSOTE